MHSPMSIKNRAASIPNQALEAVTRLAQLERVRQNQISRGMTYEAGRTLGAMSQVFAQAPTVEELRNTIANALPNGGMVSGRAYIDHQLDNGVATYSVTSQTPESVRQYVEKSGLIYAVDGRVPMGIARFVQGGVQAAAYYYASQQSRYVGSGLGAAVEISTAEKARTGLVAQDKAMYLKAAATFAGLGADASKYVVARQNVADSKKSDWRKVYEKSQGAGAYKGLKIKVAGIEFDLEWIMGPIGGMTAEEQKKHIEFWVYGTLRNAAWLKKADVATIWCAFPKEVREYRGKDGTKLIEWAFKRKVQESADANWLGDNWVWDKEFDKCPKKAADGKSGDGSSSDGSSGDMSTAAEEDNTMLIVGGAVAVLALIYFMKRRSQ